MSHICMADTGTTQTGPKRVKHLHICCAGRWLVLQSRRNQHWIRQLGQSGLPDCISTCLRCQGQHIRNATEN